MHVLHTHYALRPHVGERRCFVATFHRYGHFTQEERRVFTVCLRDVREHADRPVVAQHAWIRSSREWDSRCLERGDVVFFEATVHEKPSGKITLEDAALLAVR